MWFGVVWRWFGVVWGVSTDPPETSPPHPLSDIFFSIDKQISMTRKSRKMNNLYSKNNQNKPPGASYSYFFHCQTKRIFILFCLWFMLACQKLAGKCNTDDTTVV